MSSVISEEEKQKQKNKLEKKALVDFEFKEKEHEIEALFDILDGCDKGYIDISHEIFMQLFCCMGICYTDAQIEEIIKKVTTGFKEKMPNGETVTGYRSTLDLKEVKLVLKAYWITQKEEKEKIIETLGIIGNDGKFAKKDISELLEQTIKNKYPSILTEEDKIETLDKFKEADNTIESFFSF